MSSASLAVKHDESAGGEPSSACRVDGGSAFAAALATFTAIPYEALQGLAARAFVGWADGQACGPSVEIAWRLACSLKARAETSFGSQSNIEVWRAAEAGVRSLHAPDTEAVYFALFSTQLLQTGRVVEALEACDRGLGLVSLSPQLEAEATLRTNAATAHGLIGQFEEAALMHALADHLYRSMKGENLFVRAGNLGLWASALIDSQRARIRGGEPVDRPACRRALRVASRAIAMWSASSGEQGLQALATPAALLVPLGAQALAHTLLADLPAAAAVYRLIDAVVGRGALSLVEQASVVPGRAAYELARGQARCALQQLESVRPAIEAIELDSVRMNWYDMHAEACSSLELWQSAHESRQRHLALWHEQNSRRARALAQSCRLRLDHHNAVALRLLSQDIRLPLSALLAAARLSKRGRVDCSVRQVAFLAERGLHLAGRSVDYLRALASEPAEFRLLDLTTVIDDACEDMQELADDRGVELVRLLDGPAWVMGHESLLRRSFSNLVGNALRFSPLGNEPKVTVSLKRHAQANWRLLVVDEGAGFQALSTLGDMVLANRLPTGGYGLGLAFVAEVAAKHGTRLRVPRNSILGAHVQMDFQEVFPEVESREVVAV